MPNSKSNLNVMPKFNTDFFCNNNNHMHSSVGYVPALLDLEGNGQYNKRGLLLGKKGKHMELRDTTRLHNIASPISRLQNDDIHIHLGLLLSLGQFIS